MVGKAQQGDVPAARLVVEYVVGKPIDVDLMERLEALEDILGGRRGSERETAV